MGKTYTNNDRKTNEKEMAKMAKKRKRGLEVVDLGKDVTIKMEIQDLDQHFGTTTEDGVDAFLMANMAGSDLADKVAIEERGKEIMAETLNTLSASYTSKKSIVEAVVVSSMLKIVTDEKLIKYNSSAEYSETIDTFITKYSKSKEFGKLVDQKINARNTTNTLNTNLETDMDVKVSLISQNKIVDLSTNKETPLGKQEEKELLSTLTDSSAAPRKIQEQHTVVGFRPYFSKRTKIKMPC